MKTYPKGSKIQRHHHRGIAIVVVVSLMALLTVLVLGLLLLSSTNRNTANNDVAVRQADSIAKAATATLVSDIFAEFSADMPSTPASASDTVQRIYPVSKASSMVPSKTLKDPALASSVDFRNLVKQSANGVSFAKSGTTNIGSSRASSVSTLTPSPDQRFISKDFWKRPSLFANTASLTDTQVPDWVYLTRDGSNPTTLSPTNKTSVNAGGAVEPLFVVGRYAWQIYHLGGLLDANVALSRTTDTGDGKQAKDSPFWAAATALPGGSGLGDVIANWRHPVGKTSGGSTKLIDEWAEPNGWNKVFTDGTNTDQAFLSRQDLLAFQKQNPTAFPASLLPYFTHANHSLNQSALAPAASRPRVLSQNNGGNDGFGQDDKINPSHLAVRSAIPSEITPGTRPSVPVAARRFPLDRLALVLPNPPQAALVQKYFGLTYSAGKWTYADANIKRLTEVATLNREPNFVELLKGTLPLGSLGVSGTGPTAPGTGVALDRSVNYHIIKLVANIIDQWDEDGFPTIINFDGREFTGIEDLPRIYYVRGACYRQKVIPSSTFVGSPAGPPPPGFGSIYESVQLQQPVIWNPHAEPATPPAGAKPTKFRITATSNQASGSTAVDVQFLVYNGAGQTWQGLPTGPMNNFKRANGPDFSANPGPQRWNAANAYITFQATNSGDASFRNPYPLKSPNYPSGSNAAGAEVFPTLSMTELNFLDAASQSNQAIGFMAGKVWTADNLFAFDPGLFLHNGVRYDLQYQSGTSWITYDTMIAQPVQTQDRTSFTPLDRRHTSTWFRIDPRTNRLGIFSTNGFRGWNCDSDTSLEWKNGETGSPNVGNGRSIGGAGSVPGWNTTAVGGNVLPRYFQANLNDGRGSYIDADGVTRPAMGADAAGVTGLPLANPPITGPATSRPRILNRAFRSGAELGYVFRDIPWRQLDLSHAASADGALLDVFCLHSDPTTHDSPRITRGRVNLNTAPPEVLAALFEGTAKSVSGSIISSADALALGTALNTWVSSTDPVKGPLRSRSDLVGRTTATGSTFASQGFMSQISTILPADKSIGETCESVIRALTDSSDTRTWNIMIDLVAQSGELSKGAASLEQFIVRGQVHRWIFLSIDRFTGEILYQSSEYVSE